MIYDVLHFLCMIRGNILCAGNFKTFYLVNQLPENYFLHNIFSPFRAADGGLNYSKIGPMIAEILLVLKVL
jgi:hypothetical protein